MRLRLLPLLLGAALACDRAPAPVALRYETITTNLLDVDSIPPATLVEHEGSVVADWIMASRRDAAERLPLTLADGRRLRIVAEGKAAPLMLAVSVDDSTWTPVALLEEAAAPDPRPALMRAADGTLHLTYAIDATRFKHLALRLR